MSDPIQLVAIVVSVLLLLLVLELVRRHLLGEEYAIVWIACAGGLVALSVWREVLHAGARLVGIHYPPAAILLALVVMVFVGLLFFSVVVTRQRVQIERLIEDLAILEARHRELATRVETDRGTSDDTAPP
jgi:hypothetical protein